MNMSRLVAIVLLLVPLLSRTGAEATTWLLVNFHDSDAQSTFGTQFPSWNQIIRHPSTAYVDPGLGSACKGLSDAVGLPSDVIYYGIRGTAPIDFQPPYRIIATFYNRSTSYRYLRARCSLTDANSPDTANQSPSAPWHSMVPSGIVPPQSLCTVHLDIASAGMQHSPVAPITVGQRYLININLATSDTPTQDLILTKIELNDEADLTPPNPPVNLQATMVQVSAEAGQSVVQLSWNQPTDPIGSSGGSSGIARYFIERDDGTGFKLHGAISEAWAAHYGNNLLWRDYEVRPGVTYTYRVKAVDGSHRGWPWWVGATHQYRDGLESSWSTVSISVPGFSYDASLIDPNTDLTYLGAIKLPYGGWDYAGDGLAYRPTGNPNYNPATELPGSLYAIGHSQYDMVAEINIPLPVNSQNPDLLNQAHHLQAFAKPYPYDQSTAGDRYVHLGYHPGGNGVGERIYYSYYDNYGPPLTEPAHGALYTDLSQTGVGAWFVNNQWLDTSRFLFPIPKTWADTHASGRSLCYGSGGQLLGAAGAGNRTGPSIYAAAPWASGSLPAHGTSIPATTLLQYGLESDPMSQHLDSFGHRTAHLGAAWLEYGGKRAVVVASGVGRGDWYGYSNAAVKLLVDYDLPGTVPPGAHGPGWFTASQRGKLFFYNVKDLERVVGGSLLAYQPRPYAYFDVQSQFLGTSDEAMTPLFALAVDNTRGYLYLMTGVDENGPGAGLLYVWRMNGTPTNQPPSVSAGNNQTVTLPAAANLDGTVSDDGLPNPPAAVTTAWSKVSGPGTVTFGNASAVDTTAAFSTSGTYVLRLTANDSALESIDTVTITVSLGNAAPTANAGSDQTITLSAAANLDGTVIDDGLPTPPAAVTTSWSKVSGPGTVTFGNASAVDTTAAFSASGTYVLRLTANDSALQSTDDVTITVNPEGGAPAQLRFVAQTSINRPVGYANMYSADGIAFVPGSLYGAGQADRLILVNNDMNFVHQRYMSAWRIDNVSPGTLSVSEAQTVLGNNGVVTFAANSEASFVDDPVHPHLLLAASVWGFYSQVAVIDINLDLTTYKTINLARPGGGENGCSVAWDPLRSDADGEGLIYDGNQGGKLTITRKLTGGYPPTGSATTTGYTDPAQINGVVSARTWSATTQTFFTALENGTTIFETDGNGAFLGSTDIASLLPTGHVITGLANDDLRGYLWVFSRGNSSGRISVFSLRAALVGDINGDGTVDVVDLLYFVDSFGLVPGDPGYNPACDFNADDSVDVADLLLLVDNWGQSL